MTGKLRSDKGLTSFKIPLLIGAAAALLSELFFRPNYGAEFMAFNGFGIFKVPEVLPTNVEGWFALFTETPLVGLVLLDGADLIHYALVGFIFLGIAIVLKETTPVLVPIAVGISLVGILIYFGSNPAFRFFQISKEYISTGSESQRLILAAAGDNLLGLSDLNISYRSAGIFISQFLILIAGLLLSTGMLKNDGFRRITALTGMVANGVGLLYFPVLVWLPALNWLPPTLSAPFRLLWHFLIAGSLLKLSRSQGSR